MRTECLAWDETAGSRMGYLSAHADADRRMKAGERQTRCRVCGRYFWADEAHEHAYDGWREDKQ